VGDIAGLTASVSPNGTYVIYSQSTGDGFITKLFNTKKNTTVTLALSLLPEKCVWLKNEDAVCAGNSIVPDGVYPDAWYAGITHFQDRLYRIYTSVNTYDEIYNGEAAAFDMINLSMDEDRGLVYFIDKTTGLLWQYAI
jgi:hypothetical protein